jgi:hypothetical protein
MQAAGATCDGLNFHNLQAVCLDNESKFDNRLLDSISFLLACHATIN